MVDVGEEQRHDTAGEDEISIAARIVCHLLMGQASDHGREEINLALPVHPCRSQPFDHERNELVGWLHRGVRRFEAGDSALEEKLMANGVLARETHEVFDDGDEFFPSVSERFARQTPIEQFPLTVFEHQVVEAELRLEVGVERRLLEIDALGEVAQ